MTCDICSAPAHHLYAEGDRVRDEFEANAFEDADDAHDLAGDR